MQREAAERAVIKARIEAEAARTAAIAEARKQPKPADVEKNLANKYGAMGTNEERAFSILVDLGIVELSLEPEDTVDPDGFAAN